MEDRALISQREFVTIKTVYVLAIVFCVFILIGPLQDIIINQINNHPGVTVLFQNLAASITLVPAIFLLFCILFARGSARKTLICIALCIYALYQAAFFTIQTVQSLQLTIQLNVNSADRDAMIQGMLIYSLIPLFIQAAIQVVIPVFFLLQCLRGKTSRAIQNTAFILLGPLVFWLLFVGVRQFANEAPAAAFAVWPLFWVCLALFGCMIFFKFRPLRSSHAWQIKITFTLFILVYMAVIFCYPRYDWVTPFQTWGSFIGLMGLLAPLFFMCVAYKAIANNIFYENFIESGPLLIRKKQISVNT